MFPHFCGNWMHDLVHNALVLLLMAPEWVPFGLQLKSWAKENHDGKHT